MDTLKSLVSAAAVAPGASVTLLHHLHVQGHNLVPDSVTPSNPFFQLTAYSVTTVTFRNNGNIAYDLLALCEAWEAFERLFGLHGQDGQFSQRLQAAPFIAATSSAPATGSIVYGSGQDGTVVFDGINVFPFATLVGSTYTLTRDIFPGDGERVVTGITVNTAGFKNFGNGSCTTEAGSVVHCDGKDAVGGVAGAASALGTLGIGTAGGNGHVGVGVGSNGSAQSNTLQDAASSNQCAGGAGGAGGAQAGGTGGTYAVNNANGGANYLTPMQTGFLFNTSSGGNQATIQIIGGGAGGGGGGSDNAGVTGGGGGGGGGVLVWHAFELIHGGTLRTRGGAGAAAAGAGGNGGGGGGGGGGIILSLAWRRTGAGIYVVDGGAAGAGFGTGAAGTQGRAGHVNGFQGPM